MYTRDLIRKLWADAGLYSLKDPHLQAFLKHIDDNPQQCWDDYVDLFRREYYDLYNQLIPPLFNAGDKLLRVKLIHRADFKRRKEIEAVRAFIRDADPIAHRPELNAILSHGGRAVKNDFLARAELRHLVAPEPAPERKPTNVGRRTSAKTDRPKTNSIRRAP
jgi:hypothetical protein